MTFQRVKSCFQFLFLFNYLFSLSSCAPPPPHPPGGRGQPISSTVDLGYARYQGTVLESGVNQWLGIRFAAPPIGALRWRAPKDPLFQSGVQNATQFGATCIGSAGPALSSTTNEDCLYIDVFAPTNATTDSKLPVWFFIQGGGFAGNEDQNFNGTEVVMQSGFNMLFVQINYRVGAFGFLASEKVRKNGDLNVGLLDQRKALEWTQKYIHLFGGDPNHVVIHGDSAGGGSVVYQMTAFGGTGPKLFVGGISESPFLPTHRTVPEMEFQFDRFVSQVNCSGASDAMACLRSLDTVTLQSADKVSLFPGETGQPDWYFLPVVDGTFSPDILYHMLEQGRIRRVPLMVGDDTDEGTGFSPNAATSDQFLQFIKANYPMLTDHDLQLINASYPLGKVFPRHNPWFTPAEEAYGEATFTCPGIEISNSMAQHFRSSEVWNYRYNVIDNSSVAQGLGVPHVAEKPAIWGPGNAGPCNGCSYLTVNAPIVPIVMHYWISFIVSLNPNTHKHPSAPEWDSWIGPHGALRRLKIELNATEMEPVPQDQLNRCELWKNLAPISEQ